MPNLAKTEQPNKTICCNVGFIFLDSLYFLKDRNVSVLHLWCDGVLHRNKCMSVSTSMLHCGHLSLYFGSLRCMVYANGRTLWQNFMLKCWNFRSRWCAIQWVAQLTLWNVSSCQPVSVNMWSCNAWKPYSYLIVRAIFDVISYHWILVVDCWMGWMALWILDCIV